MFWLGFFFFKPTVLNFLNFCMFVCFKWLSEFEGIKTKDSKTPHNYFICCIFPPHIPQLLLKTELQIIVLQRVKQGRGRTCCQRHLSRLGNLEHWPNLCFPSEVSRSCIKGALKYQKSYNIYSEYELQFLGSTAARNSWKLILKASEE